jgi:hypothetical protein
MGFLRLMAMMLEAVNQAGHALRDKSFLPADEFLLWLHE